MSTQPIVVAVFSFVFATAAHSQSNSNSHAEIQTERLKAPSIDKAELCTTETLVAGMPKFPPAALRSRTEGWALVSYDLDGNGRAVNVALVGSSPSGVFEKSAVDVVMRTKFVIGTTRTGCKTLITYALQ